MRNSRKICITLLLLAALFCGGAVLGSYMPNVAVYVSILGGTVAAALLILFGYTGQVKPKTNKKKASSTSSKNSKEETFTDISSGR